MNDDEEKELVDEVRPPLTPFVIATALLITIQLLVYERFIPFVSAIPLFIYLVIWIVEAWRASRNK